MPRALAQKQRYLREVLECCRELQSPRVGVATIPWNPRASASWEGGMRVSGFPGQDGQVGPPPTPGAGERRCTWEAKGLGGRALREELGGAGAGPFPRLCSGNVLQGRPKPGSWAPGTVRALSREAGCPRLPFPGPRPGLSSFGVPSALRSPGKSHEGGTETTWGPAAC